MLRTRANASTMSPNAGATRSPSPATVSLESAMLILKGTRPSSADRTQRRTWSPSPADARQVSATPMRDASPSATALLRRPTSASAALLSRPRLSSPSPPPVSRVYGLRAAAAVSPSVERPHTGGAVPLRRATTGTSPSRDVTRSASPLTRSSVLAAAASRRDARASADGVLRALVPRIAVGASPVRASTSSPAFSSAAQRMSPQSTPPPSLPRALSRVAASLRSPSPSPMLRPQSQASAATRSVVRTESGSPLVRRTSPQLAVAQARTSSPTIAGSMPPTRSSGGAATPTPAALSAAARQSVANLAAASAAALIGSRPQSGFGGAARAIAAGERPGSSTSLASRSSPSAILASRTRPSPDSSATAAQDRLERECTRLSALLASQASQLDKLERDNAGLRQRLAQRDGDCAQLGALLAAVHRRELHPDQLADFAALPQAAHALEGRPRSAFDAMPTEDVTWEEPLSSRPAVERPSSVPPLALGTLSMRVSRLSTGADSETQGVLDAPRRPSVGHEGPVHRPASRAGPRATM